MDSRSLAVGPVALFFTGLMQILVAFLDILSGNPFGTLAFDSYGPFWVILGAINVWFARIMPASAMAMFLVLWAIVSFCFFVASFRINRALSAHLALIAIARLRLWTRGWHYAVTRLPRFTFECDVSPLEVVLRKSDGVTRNIPRVQ